MPSLLRWAVSTRYLRSLWKEINPVDQLEVGLTLWARLFSRTRRTVRHCLSSTLRVYQQYYSRISVTGMNGFMTPSLVQCRNRRSSRRWPKVLCSKPKSIDTQNFGRPSLRRWLLLGIRWGLYYGGFSVFLSFFFGGCRMVSRGIRCRLLIGCMRMIIHYCFLCSSKGWFLTAMATLRKFLWCVFTDFGWIRAAHSIVDLYAPILHTGYFTHHQWSTVGLHNW